MDLQFLSPNTKKGLGLPKQAEPSIYTPSSLMESSKPKQERITNELIIRVHRTWGFPHVCGLTEIELYDTAAQKIPLTVKAIEVRN